MLLHRTKEPWRVAAALVLFTAALIVFAPCARGEDVAMPQSTPRHRPPLNEKTLGLIKEYRELRKGKGHFSGGAWNPDLDSAAGRLVVVMTELGETIGTPGYRCDEILDLLGAPDAKQERDGKECLVYFWRGWHDYLYFICENGTVQGHKWYHAYE